MSNANLPAGGFFTQINGKRCTAIPRNAGGGGNNGGGNNNNGGGNNNNNNNNNNNGGGNGGQTQQTRTTAPPARNTSVAPPQQTSSTTAPAPAPALAPPPPQQQQPPPPAQTSSSPLPPPAQITPPAAQPAPSSPAPSPSSPAPVASSPAPPLVPPVVIPTPAVSAAPISEVQNGGAGGISSATPSDGAGVGATSQNVPPPQAAPPPSPSAGTPIASFSVIPKNQTAAPAPSAQPIVSSIAADNLQPSTAATAPPPPADNPRPSASSPLSATPTSTGAPNITPPAADNSPTGNFPLITTIGTANPTDVPAAGGSAATDGPQVQPVAQESGGASTTTIAMAGGIAGGVLLLALVAFLIWLLRKRKLRKRRSTLLTPLSPPINNGRFPSEKAASAYVINRGSIGPTPRSEKLKASLGYGFAKVKGRVGEALSSRNAGGSSGGVNMNRGNSQFMESAAAVPSRSNSMASKGPSGGNGGWLGGVAAGWRKNREAGRDANDPFRDVQERKAPMTTANNNGAQPDFLTLLGMDDRQLEREAQRKRASRNGSASSGDHFLGALGLSFTNSDGGKDDPFSDANALQHQSAKPPPLKVTTSGPGMDPFSDANAIRPPAVAKPSTYVADVRRSRGPSVSAGGAAAAAGSSNAYTRAADSYYNRESASSMDSFQTRRNKFRSDPFDLERPELLGRVTSSNLSTAGSSDLPRLSGTTNNSGVGGIQKPEAARQRAGSSAASSKYSSGVSSLGDWSDPGPDVGPAANNNNNNRYEPVSPIERGESPTRGLGGSQVPQHASRSGSIKSAGVGKAL
ncbi:hypothetical protein RB596_005456 [Gaeumannomyces avenae]